MGKTIYEFKLRAWKDDIGKSSIQVHSEPIYGQAIMHFLKEYEWDLVKSILDALTDVKNPIPVIITAVEEHKKDYNE